MNIAKLPELVRARELPGVTEGHFGGLGFYAWAVRREQASTRTAFSQGFIRDFALVWAEEGLEAVRKVAKKSPEAFVAIAARICPNDVRLTLEQAIRGGMSLEDHSLMREVIAAIREGLPDAGPNAAW